MMWMKCLLMMTATIFVSLSASGQPYYMGAYGNLPHCEACHSGGAPTNQFPFWHASSHATAYDSHPELQWDEACLPCHTTGWDLALANGGFDDFFYIGDTLGMAGLRNVQCEACHGPTDEFPHPQTTVVDCSAELCGGCHNQPNSLFYDEWALSLHGQTAQIQTQQQECARCHEAASAAVFLTTGQPSGSLPDNPCWQVTCAACHASHDSTSFAYQLRQDPAERLCRSCHSMEGAAVGEEPHSPQKEMVLGLGYGGYEWPGYNYNNGCHEMYLPEPCLMCHMWPESYGNPDTILTGHSLEPDILFCASPGCHETQIPPDSTYNILGVQTTIDSLVIVLSDLLAQADTTLVEYAQAKFDYDFVVNDGSRGIHNFLYAEGLLISSIEGLGAVMGVEASGGKNPLPTSFALSDPYPNPFNPTATFRIELPVVSRVTLEIYDVTGRLIESALHGWRDAGVHEVTFDASKLASGIYVYRLEAGQFTANGKMVLMK